ncbi:MAG: hypothetical protein A2X61_06970 [Ignavibacteria bacterium GWB2_35_12]|nr:MAG: hypothetical protein A2X61_06970 [Ignavibacteria bacterium GWB2_35_12]OGU93842.1 MAG: hypothetical protein A2220_11835 [Ignavibacteria bacterium RIFOXYA2_FULL_35_10]OGV22050.1 MAG: hypothetical protein A2475_09470 [Ignavibacteria bacterium RIFOXYC2_FULL_35_21]
MDTLELLKKAIELRKPITYEYNAPDRAIGPRLGNPHAIFISTSGNMNIDIYKLDGVRSTPDKLPAWRQYKVKNIENVIIHVEENIFEIAPGYNPVSKQYSRVIKKI